jgi:hypothetical protein
MIAVHPGSPALAEALGSFVRQRGHRKIRPRGSWPKWETRPHAVFGHCTIAVIMVSPFTSLAPISPSAVANDSDPRIRDQEAMREANLKVLPCQREEKVHKVARQELAVSSIMGARLDDRDRKSTLRITA